MESTPNHLIIVPGHATFKEAVAEVPAQPELEQYWVLQSFQAGEQTFYIEHIRAGVMALAQDPSALLLFSGGRTRLEAGPWSEAATYAAIAKHNNYWGKGGADLETRIDLEAFARDSLENLEFNLLRFHQLTGAYPVHSTIVGWEFKRERFDYHRQTLDIPSEAFTYIGCNNPDDSALTGALAGEQKTLALFKNDPHAQHDPLHAKRLERNPFGEQAPYDGLPPIDMPDTP